MTDIIIGEYLLFSIIVCFIIGACVGSFLNVCIYRIPKNLSIIHPGSFCPICQNKIPFYLNIPVLSYIFLRGRCKACKHKMSIQYPLIEILTGVLYVFIFLKSGISLEIIYWYFFVAVLITVSMIDTEYQLIPDCISIPGIFIFSSAFFFIPDMSFLESLSGILVGGGFLYIIAIFYYFIRKREGMGGGDIKLLAMIGAALGIKGSLFAIFFGSFLGCIVGLIMIFFQKKDIDFQIPFGPFLSIGALIYIFYGNQVIKWYIDFL